MAQVGKGRIPGERGRSPKPIVQDFVPSAGWTEDSNGHYLLVDLPDFKKEEVKLQVDAHGRITVSGERQSSDNKSILSFHQDFTLPPNADLNRVSGKFDSEILYVTVPKIPKQLPAIHKQNINDVVKENKQEASVQDGENVNKYNEKQGDDHGSQSDPDKKEMSGKNSEVHSFGEDFVRKWGTEPSPFNRITEIVKRHNGIVITALLAFSLGVLVSQKFKSSEQK